MSSLDVFTMALGNLFKRKTRTFLTILGVVIGTAAIVVMVSLGLAMNKTFEEELDKLGDITIITVYKPYDSGMYMSMGGGGMAVSASSSGGNSNKKLTLDQNAVEMFKRIPGVVTASAMLQTYFIFGTGKFYTWGTTVYGIDPEAMEPLGFVAAEGRLLEANDRKNVVFGAKAAYSFLNATKEEWWVDESGPPNINPMEARNMKLTYDWEFSNKIRGYESTSQNPGKIYSIKVLGVLEPKDWERDYSIFMDMGEVRKLMDERDRWEKTRNEEYGWNQGTRDQVKDTSFDRALVKCADLESVGKVKTYLESLGYPCYMPSQNLESMKNIANSLQALLAAVGAVSFLVATLGITNTMVTAIYERTKEIGVMKVIGASLSDIRKLFLTEAALIGFLGGTIGVGISIGISHFINTSGLQVLSAINEFSMQSTVSLITPELCWLSILFATVMGVVAGFFPANRAMKLSALSALRAD